ncbi:MAG: sigma-70 family RNA polymerase sigma factor [Flavobacterium sp.]|nr:MAG: sigma-70 family RNA polymerase sigma factor [Flavobacterium sp.]
MMQRADQYYIKKTLNGETNAFSELITRYRDLVFTVVLRVVKSREEAEEVAQDTFLKAFESLSSYRGESKFSTWLYSIAYRKALDQVRKSSRMKSVELVEDITEKQAQKIENALDLIEQQQRSETINKCIAALADQDAAIVTFYYFEELSVREIAAITGLTEDNIKVKLHRSRKKLFTLLKQFVLPEMTNSNGRAI